MHEAFLQSAGPCRPDRLHILHDGEIALEAALEGRSGIVVIVGTGSVVTARFEDGEVRRAGGWGYLVGDEGSGHVLGAEGIRAVLASLDGGPATSLREKVEPLAGPLPDRLIDLIYTEGWPLQQAAPLVLQAAAEGDAVAVGIVERQTALLARQVGCHLRRGKPLAPVVKLMGGLASNAYYRSALTEALHRIDPSLRVGAAERSPAQGALDLAMRPS